MHIYSLLLYICFMLAACLPSRGQTALDTTMLGTTSQVCVNVSDTKEFVRLYHEGVRTFTPVSKGNDTNKWLKSFFKAVARLYDTGGTGTIVLLNLHCDTKIWNNTIKQSPLSSILKKNKLLINEHLFTLCVSEKHLIAFNGRSSDYSFALNEHICLYTSKRKRSKQELLADFLLTETNLSAPDSFPGMNIEHCLSTVENADSTKLRSLLGTWVITGKRPHFILTAPAHLREHQQLAKALNNIPFRSVYFKKGKAPYAPVTIKEDDDLLSGGKVSFPTPDHYPLQITPQSKGHRFSPDIFMFSPEYDRQELLIRTFPLELTDKQVAHFHFDNAEAPCRPPLSKYFTSSDSMQVTDSIRGAVFFFDGLKNYVDCGSSLDIQFDKPITISAWINPYKTDLNRSIIGMGRSFTFKIHNGMLTFTRAGIRDTRFTGNKISLYKWQHAAIIFEPDKYVSLYLNGQRIGREDAAEIVTSDHSILIGSNIWGEYYEGLIDDLKIWNRALSDDEVHAAYEQKPHAAEALEKPAVKWFYGALLFFTALFFLFMHRQKKRKKADSDGCISVNEINKHAPKAYKHQSSLLTFGEFRLFTSGGQNIVPSLSPKEKQLFLYLLWHTLRSSKGGVSSRRMSEDLWPGMSSAKAKNNRSTYMQRLRKHVTGATNIQISYTENKKWTLILPPHYNCDLISYHQLLTLFQETPQLSTLNNWLAILNEGAFLPETHNEPVDQFKAEIENEIIQNLTSETSIDLAFTNHLLTQQITTTIRRYDPLNEPALCLELRWLTKSGHHGRALDAFQRFSREYEMMYGEKLNKEMNDLLY